MSAALGGIRGATRVALVLALASAGGRPLATAASAMRPVAGDSRLQALIERRPDGPQDERALVQAWARLGLPAVPELFELQLSAGFEAFLPAELDPATWVVPPDEVPELALQALALLPQKAVLAHVRARLSGERDLELVLACARTIGAAASAEGLPMLLEILDGFGTDWGFPHARATVSRALRGLLQDPLCAQALTREWRRIAPGTRDILIEALLASKEPAAAEFLLTQVGADPALDLRILAEVSAPFERVPWRIEALDVAGLERALVSPEPLVRARAVAVFGRLFREDGLDRLVACVADPDPRVQRAATAVLRAWSGNVEASTPADWEAWAAEEERWHVEGLRELLASIDADRPPEVAMAAANELARRPIHRRDAVLELAALISRASPELAPGIVRTLVLLDGREAIPDLIEELDAPDDGLRLEVWKTLRALTGEDLGPDVEDWRAWLER